MTATPHPDNLTGSTAWQALQAHRATQNYTLADLYVESPDRAWHYGIEAAGLSVDYSRHPVTDETMGLLHRLAVQEDVTGWRRRLFAGEAINATENRAVTHWQWRMAQPPADIAATRARMHEVASKIRAGSWLGATGKPIRHIVNIGIGGSDLGPRLLVDALSPLTPQPITVDFVRNVDPVDLARVLARCDAAETLFIIASKTMTTLETRLNAEAATAWLRTSLGNDISQHVLAVTSHPDRAAPFGVLPQHCFDFASSVGGRYSVWGPPSLAALIVLGPEIIAEFHAGAAAMDAHFQQAEAESNLPLTLALLSIWQVNFHNAANAAVLPYATMLGKLPAYLQQLVMESNGKGISRTGAKLQHATAPVIFGESGTIGQHSFHQLLHQGTTAIPADFIIARHTDVAGEAASRQQQWLVASALAQSAALLYGHDDADPHRRHPGNRPSTLIWIDRVTPHALGALLALYEHKTFVEGILWRINSFDQFGVELGKTIATSVQQAMTTGVDNDLDEATRAGLMRYRQPHLS